MSTVEIVRGGGPVILGMPHTGTLVPAHVEAGLNDTGRALADTDWHIHQLYDDLLPGATIVRQVVHRYAIDVNRDPSGASLYPGQNTTGLCPTTDFDGRPLYKPDCEPTPDEIEFRRITFHEPYHDSLTAEIRRIHAIHGVAVLYDCHSIRSKIPFLFEGTLPDFNIGTNGGVTCDPEIERGVAEICARAQGYTSILNGRFTGGWTTRHYGDPARGVHAIQMELAQSAYLASESEPFSYSEVKAERLRPHLRAILHSLEAWALRHAKA
jgi:N-formylglutamate deformylase